MPKTKIKIIPRRNRDVTIFHWLFGVVIAFLFFIVAPYIADFVVGCFN